MHVATLSDHNSWSTNGSGPVHEAREGLAEAVGVERVSCRQGIASGVW